MSNFTNETIPNVPPIVDDERVNLIKLLQQNEELHDKKNIYIVSLLEQTKHTILNYGDIKVYLEPIYISKKIFCGNRESDVVHKAIEWILSQNNTYIDLSLMIDELIDETNADSDYEPGTYQEEYEKHLESHIVFLKDMYYTFRELQDWCKRKMEPTSDEWFLKFIKI